MAEPHPKSNPSRPVSPSVSQSSQQAQPDLWNSLQGMARWAGRNLVEKALRLYYAAQRPETPLWAKMVIYSSLVYLVLPTDAIPDFTPFVGYSDDLSTLLSALAAVAMSITPDIKEAARQKAEEWLGDEPQATASSEGPQAGDVVREIAIE